MPNHWRHYWTKYPEGYTILEALLDWVGQVDKMVDNLNNLNEAVSRFRNELDDFIERFDPRLREEVTTILEEWQDSGFLEVIIDEAIKTRIDNITVLLYPHYDNEKIQELMENGGTFKFVGDHIRTPLKIPNNVVLIASDTATIYFDSFERDIALFHGDGVQNVTIQGLTVRPLNSETEAACLIEFEDSENIKILNNHILAEGRAEGDGIRIRESKNILIKGNTITDITLPHYNNTEASGIRVTSTDYVWIENNIVKNTNREGIGLSGGCSNCWIVDNVVDTCMQNFPIPDTFEGAIDCYGPNEENIFILHNTIANTGSSAPNTSSSNIRLSGSHNVTVEGNDISSSYYVKGIIVITARTNVDNPSYPRNINILNNDVDIAEGWQGRRGIYLRNGEVHGGFNISGNRFKGDVGNVNTDTGFVWVQHGVKNLVISDNEFVIPTLQEPLLYFYNSSNEYAWENVKIMNNTVDIGGTFLMCRLTNQLTVMGNHVEATDIFDFEDGVTNVVVMGNGFVGDGVVGKLTYTNIWQGVFEQGGIDSETGGDIDSDERIRSANFTPIELGVRYRFLSGGEELEVNLYLYDENNLFIRESTDVSSFTIHDPEVAKIRFTILGNLEDFEENFMIQSHPRLPLDRVRPQNLGDFNQLVDR